MRFFHALYLRGLDVRWLHGWRGDIDGLRKDAVFRHVVGIEAALPLLVLALSPAAEKSAFIGKASQP